MNTAMLRERLGTILGIDTRRHFTPKRAVDKNLQIVGGMAWILVSRG